MPQVTAPACAATPADITDIVGAETAHGNAILAAIAPQLESIEGRALGTPSRNHRRSVVEAQVVELWDPSR